MNADSLCRFLLAAMRVNYAVLRVWFFAFLFARDWIKGLHGRWFRLSDAGFDAIHYGGMAVYKIGILLFNVSPLLALWFAGRGG